ncbi:hypothetical protein BASA50_000618 [Batrachochytrium salamandrivorans]|uniref:Chitin-binding type-2 domain-containing protein n=1 Tax=Batrachochytrium salamandrivorans TaxID=1357716 RepID=A0ABQ8ET30_9FUNG|nr:hypothetical protein BASA50_000618 [Batrachochytrium salamandrivorans]
MMMHDAPSYFYPYQGQGQGQGPYGAPYHIYCPEFIPSNGSSLLPDGGNSNNSNNNSSDNNGMVSISAPSTITTGSTITGSTTGTTTTTMDMNGGAYTMPGDSSVAAPQQQQLPLLPTAAYYPPYFVNPVAPYLPHMPTATPKSLGHIPTGNSIGYAYPHTATTAYKHCYYCIQHGSLERWVCASTQLYRLTALSTTCLASDPSQDAGYHSTLSPTDAEDVAWFRSFKKQCHGHNFGKQQQQQQQQQ